MDKKELGHIRREYKREKLDESKLPGEPLKLFTRWLEQAHASGHTDPTAMTLSTVDGIGHPSSRIVLLKKIQDGSLVFYTNYHSRKSLEIRAQSMVAAHFYWSGLERQVLITGHAHQIDALDSDQYFRTRPFESNVCAWASPQSKVVPHRSYLENEFERYLKRFAETDLIPRPSHWGGYAITPVRIEFWQGGLHRLHDRIEYSLVAEGWSRVRLAP